ncbi:MAG: hypothetical protein MJ231_01995 [bacterium]|nr:hypothetical protein [bacterium]
MALLLAVFQKMRVIREYNEAVRESIGITSKIDRAKKNIANKQKWYQSLFSQIDSNAKMMQNNATVMFQNQLGLGCMGLSGVMNPMSYMQGGLNGFICNFIGNALTQGGFKANKDAEPLEGMDKETIEGMFNEYMTNGTFLPKDKDKPSEGYANYTEDQVAAFMTAMRNGQMAQQQAQMQLQQWNSMYQQDVTAWAENQKAMLTCQQDEELDALNYEETMLELDKAELDERMALLKAEKESYNQLCQEEARDAAPKFGLG